MGPEKREEILRMEAVTHLVSLSPEPDVLEGPAAQVAVFEKWLAAGMPK